MGLLSWFRLLFSRKKGFLTLGISRSGKTTLMKAAEALKKGNDSYDCRKEKTDATSQDKVNLKISLPGIDLCFYFVHDYGGDYSNQEMHLREDLPEVQNIIYCFDAHILAEDEIVDRNGIKLKDYAKTAILQCIKVIKNLQNEQKKIKIKNFIFLGTHYDEVKDHEQYNENVLMKKIGFNDLQKKIKGCLPDTKIAFVCGSFISLDEARNVWKRISDNLN